MPAYALRSSSQAVFGPASLWGWRFGGFPDGRKGKKAPAWTDFYFPNRALIAAICSGPMPQQPPTMEAPWAIQPWVKPR